MYLYYVHVKKLILFMCKKFMKVTHWKEKLLKVLVDPIKEKTDERKIVSKLNYYQRLDTQDVVVAGRIGDVESNY